MGSRTRSESATTLAADLLAAASALVAVLEPIEPEGWTRLPEPSVWSVGKDAAHVAEAAAYHQWIVRLTIGEKVSGRRPAIERQELTTAMTTAQTIALIRERTEEGAALISSLSDEQLALPTRPPRARGQVLADTIRLVLIDHYAGHRRDIERKLRDGGPASLRPRFGDTIPPEALLDDFPPPMQAIAYRLREIVLAAIPDAIERVRPGWRLIGYDLPIRKNGIYFAYVAPEVEHVHLGFEHGWAMRDPERLLAGQGITKQVRWLTFRPGDEIDTDRCQTLVHEAARVAALTRGERALLAMDEDRGPT